MKMKTSLLVNLLILVIFTSCKIDGVQSSWDSKKKFHIDNPYKEIDWDNYIILHSMSHQHAGTYGEKDISRMKKLADMGFDHFLITNYYPSNPIYPLPDELTDNYTIIEGPNTEHHSVTNLNFGYHFSAIGSQYESGYGKNLLEKITENHFSYSTTDLNIYNESSIVPGSGVYRLDITSNAKLDTSSQITLTIKGVVQVDRMNFEVIGGGKIQNRIIRGGESESYYFKVLENTVEIDLQYDSNYVEITQFRIMQGSNRPWQQLFSQILDGGNKDNNNGLLYKNAGGIVINHPYAENVDEYLKMLDFDERVLGIEVWNHRRFFGLEDEEPHMRFYNHWDTILSTGRKSYGFFVKDHRVNGLGRNILMVPDTTGRDKKQREIDALSAYNKGHFFGLLGAPEVQDDNNNVGLPYDFSEFRFNKITVDSTTLDGSITLSVEVVGNDIVDRPNIQIRFITDHGISKIINNDLKADFEVKVNNDGVPEYKYVRVEAISYPDTYNQGEELTKDMVNKMNVYELIRLHDFKGYAGGNDIDSSREEHISIVDIIFSQPIRFIASH